MERQPAPAARDPDQPAVAPLVPPLAEEPETEPIAAEDDVEAAGDGLWVGFLLGIALLLAICVVLTLVAYYRAPVGAPG